MHCRASGQDLSIEYRYEYTEFCRRTTRALAIVVVIEGSMQGCGENAVMVAGKLLYVMQHIK